MGTKLSVVENIDSDPLGRRSYLYYIIISFLEEKKFRKLPEAFFFLPLSCVNPFPLTPFP
jgi:hypothetical protein